MLPRPDHGEKPVVQQRVRSYRQLLKYVKKPVCLRCGYDIHIQLRHDQPRCPECGQACDFDSLGMQLASQRYDRTPILMDALSGVLLLIMLPPLILIGNLISVLLLSPFVDENIWLVIVPTTALVLLAWTAMMALSIADIYKAFDSMYGLWVWLLAYIYVIVYIFAVGGITIWFGMIVGSILNNWLYPSDPAWTPPAVWAWIHIGGVLCIGIFLLNAWWSKRYAILPCRERCGVLATALLNRRDWENDGSSSPANPQADQTGGADN